MVRRVTIKNFKSIEDLSLDLGRCTVFIGANGSGKSNILEAIALASAAAADRVDNEFLASRGIRVTDTAAHMSSAFEHSTTTQPVDLTVTADVNISNTQTTFHYSLIAEQFGAYVRWAERKSYFTGSELEEALERADKILQRARESVSISSIKESKEIVSLVDKALAPFTSVADPLDKFVTYSPEAKALRNFESEGQILPLGIHGEGLFRLLKSILADKNESRAKQIKESLKVVDWFIDFSMPDNLMNSEYSLQIRDRYLADDLAVFDQRSTNEGFLYLLFYFTLFCAEETPKFFAIDNIDDSLNPRLSAETIKNLVQLAKEHDKQFLATTHQPGLLDGLNLSDPEQILYIVFRNLEGRTSVRRVQPPKTNGSEPVRLSEAFIRGYLGGLPNHF